jgi:FAD/FMN-containing dehydrogenase
VSTLSRLRSATGDAVTTFELIPRLGLDLVTRHVADTSDPLDARYEWYVLMEVSAGRSESGLRELLERELFAFMEEGTVLDAVIAQSEAQRQALWRLRETIPEGQRREGASIKHDISVATSELPRFIAEASRVLKTIAPDSRLLPYGHLGDGNLHFNLSEPVGGDSSQFVALAPRIHREMHDLVAQYGGSFSAEHGIGQLKRQELARYKHPVALEIMHSIKRALDPKGIMNPGKVL